MALSGVFIGGGIAPKILARMKDGSFMRAFTDKGRFSEMMRRIPVKVALNPQGGAHRRRVAGARAVSCETINA